MYSVHINKGAAAAIARLPRNLRERIAAAIEGLAENPRPHGYIRLKGHENYRVRVGDWRIIYSIEDAVLIVTVLKVATRGQAYR